MRLHLGILLSRFFRKCAWLLAVLLFPLAVDAVEIDWVPVGDAYNAADTVVMATDGTTGYGRVSYDFEVGKVEVTNSQYAEFLNAVAGCSDDVYGLFNPEMESDAANGGITQVYEGFMCEVGDPGNAPDVNGMGSVADLFWISPYETTNNEYAALLNAVAVISDEKELYNPEMDTSPDGGIIRSGEEGAYEYTVKEGFEFKPVNFVSFWDAARYVNWLANGEPVGVAGNTTTEKGSYDLDQPAAYANNTIQRNSGATIFVPNRDEFYKAAYYDTESESYFLYPAGSSDEIACSEPGEEPNTANCLGGPGGVTETGAYTEALSPNLTFDQGGNLDEWTESITAFFFVWYRISLGGSYADPATSLVASTGVLNAPTPETATRGFRIARNDDPERYEAKAGSEERPVSYVSFWNALRFVNWVGNGQPLAAAGASTTETGAYTLTEEGMAANTIKRNWTSRIFLSSEDEWYKAAYYDATTAGYFAYPTSDGSEIDCAAPAADDASDTANCGDAITATVEGVGVPISSDVGAYPETLSSYGSLDQGGNLFEWNDTIVDTENRGMRGGFYGASEFSTESVARGANVPSIETASVGFRLTQVPEPAGLLLQWVALAVLAALGRRSAIR